MIGMKLDAYLIDRQPWLRLILAIAAVILLLAGGVPEQFGCWIVALSFLAYVRRGLRPRGHEEEVPTLFPKSKD